MEGGLNPLPVSVYAPLYAHMSRMDTSHITHQEEKGNCKKKEKCKRADVLIHIHVHGGIIIARCIHIRQPVVISPLVEMKDE